METRRFFLDNFKVKPFSSMHSTIKCSQSGGMHERQILHIFRHRSTSTNEKFTYNRAKLEFFEI